MKKILLISLMFSEFCFAEKVQNSNMPTTKDMDRAGAKAIKNIITQAKSVNTQAKSVNTQAKSINTQAKSVNTQAKSINTQAKSVNTQAKSINTRTKSINAHKSPFYDEVDIKLKYLQGASYFNWATSLENDGERNYAMNRGLLNLRKKSIYCECPPNEYESFMSHIVATFKRMYGDKVYAGAAIDFFNNIMDDLWNIMDENVGNKYMNNIKGIYYIVLKNLITVLCDYSKNRKNQNLGFGFLCRNNSKASACNKKVLGDEIIYIFDRIFDTNRFYDRVYMDNLKKMIKEAVCKERKLSIFKKSSFDKEYDKAFSTYFDDKIKNY